MGAPRRPAAHRNFTLKPELLHGLAWRTLLPMTRLLYIELGMLAACNDRSPGKLTAFDGAWPSLANVLRGWNAADLKHHLAALREARLIETDPETGLDYFPELVEKEERRQAAAAKREAKRSQGRVASMTQEVKDPAQIDEVNGRLEVLVEAAREHEHEVFKDATGDEWTRLAEVPPDVLANGEEPGSTNDFPPTEEELVQQWERRRAARQAAAEAAPDPDDQDPDDPPDDDPAGSPPPADPDSEPPPPPPAGGNPETGGDAQQSGGTSAAVADEQTLDREEGRVAPVEATAAEESRPLRLRLKERLQQEMDPEEYARWFDPLRVSSETADRIVLRVPHERFLLALEEGHRPLINRLEEEGGFTVELATKEQVRDAEEARRLAELREQGPAPFYQTPVMTGEAYREQFPDLVEQAEKAEKDEGEGAACARDGAASTEGVRDAGTAGSRPVLAAEGEEQGDHEGPGEVGERGVSDEGHRSETPSAPDQVWDRDGRDDAHIGAMMADGQPPLRFGRPRCAEVVQFPQTEPRAVEVRALAPAAMTVALEPPATSKSGAVVEILDSDLPEGATEEEAKTAREGFARRVANGEDPEAAKRIALRALRSFMKGNILRRQQADSEVEYRTCDKCPSRQLASLLISGVRCESCAIEHGVPMVEKDYAECDKCHYRFRVAKLVGGVRCETCVAKHGEKQQNLQKEMFG